MKVKICSITKFMTTIMILMNYSYFKLLGNQFSIFSTSYNQYPLVMFYTVMVVLIVALGNTYAGGTKYLNRLSAICVLTVCIGMFNAMSNNGANFMMALSSGIWYIYVLLAIPLYNLLICDKWNFRKLLKLVLFLGLGAYALRAFISIYYGMTGTLLYPNIAEESAVSGWIRNGALRVNPPFIGIIFAPIAYYLALTTTKKAYRLLYYLSIVAAMLYTVQIHQARSLMIYQLVTIVALFTFEKVNDKKKLFRMAILFIAVVVLINTPWISNLMDSFSGSNADYGNSTVFRINAIVEFGSRYLRKPIFGLGFLTSADQTLSIGGILTGNIADIGILRSIFMLGVPMILVFLLIFSRGFYVYFKVKKNGMGNEALLVLGMTVLVIMTGINIDLFFGIFAFAIPFYLAITEYVLYKSKENTI